jgi:fibronectin-binding autotransporter adhesin
MQFGRLAAAASVGILFSSTVIAQTFTWTGVGTGWRNQATPNSGTADLYFFNGVRNEFLLTGNQTFDSLVYVGDDVNYFKPAVGTTPPLVLTLNSGISYIPHTDPAMDPGRFDFASGVQLAITSAQVFDIGHNNFTLHGELIGSANLTLRASTSSVSGATGYFVFNNSGSGNSAYSGNLTLDFASSAGIAFWNSQPFGTGAVSVVNGGQFVAHGTQNIANNLTLNTGGSSNSYFLRSWDAPLTFSGAVTLANNVTLAPALNPNSVEFANLLGSLVVPGATGRDPIIFSGAISQTGGVRSITVAGQGLVIFAPTSASTYSGGTIIGSGSAGTVIFGNNNAFPATGTVSMGQSNSYAGIADISTGNFAAQINAHFDKAMSGAVGVDTLPGNSTITFTEAINLSSTGTGALSFTNSNIRLGTATSAILTGALTPQGTNYQFGSGGGALYVQSNLGDTAGNGVTATRNVTNTSPGSFPPLKLYLQGVNSYSGGTTATGGFVIFDGIAALPVAGALVTSGSSTAVGNGYIGTTVVGPSSTFLSRFTAGSNWGIIGFDTHEGSGTTIVNGINLTGFNDGVFLGTATSAAFTGTLTPSTVTNANNAANTLRLTAGNGGTLTVDSTLADPGPALAVILGTPSTANHNFGNGTVILNGANTYTGSTIINANSQGLTVNVGHNNAFGTGTVTLNAPSGGIAGLSAASAGLTIGNDIVFAHANSSLHLTGNNSFTLAGDIFGSGTIQLQRSLSGTQGAATLSGDNSGFSGFINLQHFALTFAHDQAAGHGQLQMFDPTSEAVFTTAAPVLYGLDARDGGKIILSNGANLTLSNDANEWGHEFSGSISGVGGAPVNAILTVDGASQPTPGFAYLSGANSYTGGTSIVGNASLALGHSQAAGSGTITINSPDGGLGLNTGVTLTNALVLTQGGLAGFGTFAPTSFNGVAGGPITIGANQFVLPGLPDNSSVPAGTLTFAGNTVFQNGGIFGWTLQNPGDIDGSGHLLITGSLDLTTLATSGFLLSLSSYDPLTAEEGSTSLTLGNSYNFTILTANGGILGFEASDFAIDATLFQDGVMSASAFSLAQSGNSLVLNFTAVPEPSTWALLVAGAFSMAVTAWRRRIRREASAK